MLDDGFWSDDYHWVAAAIRQSHDPMAWRPPETANHGNPLASASFVLDLLRGGTSPRAFLETNLALHVLCALALLAVAAQLLESVPLGFAAALCWATSPLVSETVLWISARAHSLSMAPALLALLFLLRARPGRQRRALAAAALLFTMAFLGKETTVAFAPVLALAALQRGGGPPLRRPLLVAAGAFALAGLLMALRLALLPPLPVAFDPVRMAAKVAFALDGYFLPGLRSRGEGIVGAGGVLFLLLLAYAVRRRSRAGLFGALLLVSSLAVTLPRLLHASRYDYTPHAGAVLMVASALKEAISRLAPERRQRALAAAAGLAALLVAAQLVLVRQEERAYALLGRETRAIEERHGPALAALPCGEARLLLIATTSRLPRIDAALREIGGMPRALLPRRDALGQIVPADMLATIVHHGGAPACVCDHGAGTPPGRALVLDDAGARELGAPLPPAVAAAVRAGAIRSLPVVLTPVRP